MTYDDFMDALKRLVDTAYGEVNPDAMIEALEGRIGVIKHRMEEVQCPSCCSEETEPAPHDEGFYRCGMCELIWKWGT